MSCLAHATQNLCAIARTNMRKLTLAILPLVFLIGCSSEPKQPAEKSEAPPAEKPAEKPSEYETGRTAFQKLYVSARAFAGDIQPYMLESTYTKESPAKEGKAGIWRAGFASPSRRAIKAYTWSGMSGEDMPDRGVSRGTEDEYNPSNSSTQVFDMAFLKVDSDKALQASLKKGGQKLLDKDPNQPIVYRLRWNPRENKLMWHIWYGTDRSDAKLRHLVDATTGQYIGKER
jgi:hypothetical protein